MRPAKPAAVHYYARTGAGCGKTVVRPVASSTVECAATVQEAANAVQNSITAIVSTLQQAEAVTQEPQTPGWADMLSELAKQAGNADKQTAVLIDRSDRLTKQVTALSGTCEQLAEERDAAIKTAQESRDAAAAIKAEAAEVKADAQARLSSMSDERSWWRKCALYTWAGIAVFVWRGSESGWQGPLDSGKIFSICNHCKPENR